MMKLLVKNIGQLVTVVEGGEVCLAGKGMGQIKVGSIREINVDYADHADQANLADQADQANYADQV